MDKENKSFLGRGWHFPPGFTKGMGVDMVSDEEDIRQSLVILFTTNRGERIMRFDYGCDISRWVFAEMTLSEKTMIRDAIEMAILFHEPRIDDVMVDIGMKDPGEGVLQINVDYRIRGTNSRSNMVFPFYFKEGTLI